MTELPVACSLSEHDLRERRAGLLDGLRRHRREARVLPDGIALRYGSEPDSLASVFEFILLERQCCPFLRFRLTVEPGGGPVWLELTGPAGTREFLAREIEGPGEAAPASGSDPDRRGAGVSR